MKCENCLEKMSLYLDEDLNKQEQEELFNHIAECESCKKEFEELKNIVGDLRKAEFLELPENYHKELMERISEEKIIPVDFTSKKKSNWKKYTSIAAGFLVLVVLGIGRGYVSNNQYGEGGSSNTAYSKSGISESYSESPMAPMEMRGTGGAMDGGEVVYNQSFAEENGASVENDILAEEVSEDKEKGTSVTERKKIKNASLSISVDSFDAAAMNIRQNVEGNGGYVENFYSYIFYEDLSRDISLKAGNLNMRVPQENYESSLAYIKTLGKVNNENEGVNDITNQYIDTEARLNVKKAEEKRLIELLEKAENLTDIMAIEGRLSEVRGYIESIEEQLKGMDKLVSYSTINIDIQEKEPRGVSNISDDFGKSIKDSFIKSINFVVKGFQQLILNIVEISLPAVVVGITGFVVYKIIRFVIKRRNEKKNNEIK